VSRTQSKLLELGKEIKEKYGVETKNLAMDFAANRDKDFASLRKLVEDVGEVSILVNNVGLSHSIPVPFAETPEQEMKDIITINCMGTLRVTQLVVPGMIKRRRGLILTMASFGGIMPTPLLATYSGSKAFLQQWSTALSSELAPHNITVQLVQSYLVTSAMSKIRRSSLLVPTPKQFVRAALGKIGRSGGAQGILATCTPYWAHAVMHWAIATFIGTMNAVVVGVNKRMHEDIRKRALAKAERDAKKSS
jgi:17beta-estradiol 17-dehydrogenase / very-long-chain 3-oxoacyl-CoA reductase